jgi:hypothetical protein
MQVALASLITVQIAFLVLRTQNIPFKTNTSVAADTLSFVATGIAAVLSLLSHQRCLRPSTLLSLYLSALAILGIARTRTVWLIEPRNSVPAIMTVAYVLSLVVLFLESIEKKQTIVTEDHSAEKPQSPEQKSGFWTRTCFTWLAATFWLGYSKVISLDNLPALDNKLESKKLRRKLMFTWGNCEYLAYLWNHLIHCLCVNTGR